jgi:hypothetical protein
VPIFLSLPNTDLLRYYGLCPAQEGREDKNSGGIVKQRALMSVTRGEVVAK